MTAVGAMAESTGGAVAAGIGGGVLAPRVAW
jgi:hypothetical protein